MKRMIGFAVFTLVAGLSLSLLSAADDAKPKYTIKQVMKFHKDKLHEKLEKGEASKEEKQMLLEGYESMLKLKPPKGDEADWKTKCEALIKAVKDDDKVAYKKAYNCGACHSAHKG
jgi:translation initiation factor IF-3